MKISCNECPLRELPAFARNEPGEIDFIAEFKRTEKHFKGGETMIRESDLNPELFTLLSGWAFRYKSLSDGRRQILNFLMPGDLIGLQEQLADISPHGVETLTEATTCVFHREELWNLYREFPSLGYDITWLSAHEEHIVDENLMSVGQRTARERIGILLLQLYKRAEKLDLINEEGMHFPITQQHIADALGLSLVHTNKTLRQLQKIGLFEFSRGRLKLLNVSALVDLADLYEVPLRNRPLI